MRNLTLCAATLVAGVGVYCACKFENIYCALAGIFIGAAIGLIDPDKKKPVVSLVVDVTEMTASLASLTAEVKRIADLQQKLNKSMPTLAPRDYAGTFF